MIKPNYFDAHSHLNFPSFKEDLEDVLRRMKEEKIWTITVLIKNCSLSTCLDQLLQYERDFLTQVDQNDLKVCRTDNKS